MTASRLPPRVCLITPFHLSANPRIVKEADALAEAGCEVTVISTDYTAWARRADEEFADRPWRSAPKISFGPQAPAAIYMTQTVRRRSARALARLLGRWPGLVHSAIHPVAPDLTRAALAVQADLYIAHYTAALPAAATAARLRNARYAFDAEDFHPGDLPDRRTFAFDRALIANIEERFLSGCAHITAASPGIALAYAKAYGLPELPRVVLNVFQRSDAPCRPNPEGTVSPRPSVYWFSQTLGPGRGLEAAVEAIAIASSRPSLHLRGTPSAGFAQALHELARRLGVEDRLVMLPVAAPGSLVRLAAQYDLGLVGELSQTHNRQIALTNKLFTYLLAGVPVLASDIPAHHALEGMGGAIRLFHENGPKSLAAAMDHFLGDPQSLAGARQEAWQLGQTRYNWDVEKQALLDAVGECWVRP